MTKFRGDSRINPSDDKLAVSESEYPNDKHSVSVINRPCCLVGHYGVPRCCVSIDVYEEREYF